jgi:glycosyltransferase involved in cell wall biosynthesis
MKITVFTSSYNYGKYLRQSIESVINQTYQDWEYLLIDYGSTDDSYKIMQEYAGDKRVRIFQIGSQKNIATVLNYSLLRTTGDYWSWCPADDYWAKNLLEEKVKYIDLHPMSVLYHDFWLINDIGKVTGFVDLPDIGTEEFHREIWKRSLIAFTGIFIPMDVIRDFKLYFPEHLPFSEDFYWAVRASIYKVPFIHVPKRLHFKRSHEGAMISRHYDEVIKKMANIWAELKVEKDNHAT